MVTVEVEGGLMHLHICVAGNHHQHNCARPDVCCCKTVGAPDFAMRTLSSWLWLCAEKKSGSQDSDSNKRFPYPGFKFSTDWAGIPAFHVDAGQTFSRKGKAPMSRPLQLSGEVVSSRRCRGQAGDKAAL